MDWTDALATVGWALLALGWAFRRHRRRHLACVVPGMAIDLALVLYLEFTRSVIERTVGDGRAYAWTEQVHIATSTAAVVLYVPTIWLGILLWRGAASPRVRAWHKRVAVPALALRTVGFAFMWTVVGTR